MERVIWRTCYAASILMIVFISVPTLGKYNYCISTFMKIRYQNYSLKNAISWNFALTPISLFLRNFKLGKNAKALYFTLKLFNNLNSSFKGLKEPFTEKEIHNFVFNNSNKDIRPELAHAVPTHVHFDMKLQKIVNLVRRKFLL